MESPFLNWARGNRLTNFGGITEVGDSKLIYSKDYQFLQVELLEAFNTKTEEIVTKAVKGDRIKLIPAISVGEGAPRKYRLMVEVNPALADYVDFLHVPNIIENGDDIQPTVTAKFDRSFTFSKLDWLIRLYLVA